MIERDARSGQPLKASDWNSAMDAVRRAGAGIAGPGIDAIQSAGGLSFSRTPVAEALEDCKRAVYTSALTLPIGALVHFTDSGAVALPDYSGQINLGILREGAATNHCPWVQYKGVASVYMDIGRFSAMCDWSAFRTWKVRGKRLGCVKGLPFAQWDANGPLVITDYSITAPVVITTAGGDEWQVARVNVRFDRRFADTVHCYRTDEDECAMPFGWSIRNVVPEGPYACWVFGSGCTVTESEPGAIEVTTA